MIELAVMASQSHRWREDEKELTIDSVKFQFDDMVKIIRILV